MKKDIFGRRHFHQSFEKKKFKAWFNWRPSVFHFGFSVVLNRKYIEIDFSFYFDLTISIIFKSKGI